MHTAQPTVWEFLKVFKNQWKTAMTGGFLAAVFMGLTLYVGQRAQQRMFAILAASSALLAAFEVWSSERQNRCSLEEQIRILKEVPHVSQDLVAVNENMRESYYFAVRMTNIGRQNFALDKIEVLVSDGKPEIHDFNESIAAGDTNQFPIGKIYRGKDQGMGGGFDVQIRAHVRWLTHEAWLAPCGYHVSLGVQLGDINRVKTGYKEDRQFDCPKCNGRPFIFMSVQGIDTERDFQKRKATFLEEMNVSCPDHYSQFATYLAFDRL